MDMTLSLSSSSSSSIISRIPNSSTFSFLPPNSLFLKKKVRIRSTRRKGLTCNALLGLGVPELLVIAGVAALVFGPKNLPQVGRSIGKTIKGFQQAAKEFESELKKEPDYTEENRAEAEQEIKDSV
ncbi:hypothetical protein RJT34_22844 [Clitoria ternatea]|uniref:Uncharacterized protein n=1 Tax=Clitoria ternatea TaxID=43366 RepID=A0AAN9FJU1_CLITE